VTFCFYKEAVIVLSVIRILLLTARRISEAYPAVGHLVLHRPTDNFSRTYEFYCFTVHFNSLNLIYQLMHFYIQ